MSDFEITRRKFILLNSKLITITTLMPSLLFQCAKAPLRFGLVTDSHYAERAANGTRFYSGALEKMKAFVSVMNREKVDFVIHLGDFKDEDKDQKTEDTLRYLKDIENVYAAFKGPRYHCIGNHDVDSITKTQFLQHVTNTGINEDKSYYAFDHSGFHFLVLDANFDKQGRDHYFKAGSNWEDTNITKDQLTWLEEDLLKNQLPVIVFCHHPLFEFYREGKKYHVNNYEQVMSIIKNNASVVACFHGHVHQEKHYEDTDGIHYLTQLGMVDYKGLNNNSFSIVEINDKTLNIYGYKRATNNTFNF